MQINIKIIRDIEVIEKELNNISAGVFLFSNGDEFVQFASSFVYINKNIYLFIQDADLLKKIGYDTKARFTAIKERKQSKSVEGTAENIYSIISFSVNGVLKQVDEEKVINSIKQNFIQKYSGRFIESGSISKSFRKLVYIYSEELTATEETGV